MFRPYLEESLIDLMNSADPLKPVSGLKLILHFQAILKFRHPGNLDYRANHGPLTVSVCIEAGRNTLKGKKKGWLVEQWL